MRKKKSSNEDVDVKRGSDVDKQHRAGAARTWKGGPPRRGQVCSPMCSEDICVTGKKLRPGKRAKVTQQPGNVEHSSQHSEGIPQV